MLMVNEKDGMQLPQSKSDPALAMRQELESREAALLENGDFGAALKLRETADWQDAFPIAAGAIDADYFKLLSGQMQQIAEQAQRFITRSPYACARFLVGLRRANGQSYSHLAHIVRSVINRITFDDGEAKVALKLSIEDYKNYNGDITRAELIQFFNKNQAYVCRFFQTAMVGNLPLFHGLVEDFIESPSELGGFNEAGLFRFLTLAYVFLDHEKFEKILNLLRDGVDQVSGGLTLSPAVTRVVEAFLDQKDANVSPTHLDSSSLDRPLKIAVCISGQLRGYGEAFETWKYLQLEGHDVSYFVHTWEDIGWRFPDPISGNGVFRVFRHQKFVDAYRRAGFLYGREKLIQSYPNLFAAITVAETATQEDIKAVYGHDATIAIEDHQQPQFADDVAHQRKMFYKIRESHRLMEEDDRNFDLVIRIRPDRAFRQPRPHEAKLDWEAIWKTCRDKRTLFFGHLIVVDTIHAGDQLAVGSPEAMRAYANTLDLQDQACKEKWFEMPGRLRPHVSLGHALLIQGIKREPLEGVFAVDPVPAARLGYNGIRQALTLDMPNGPQTEMDRMLWDSLDRGKVKAVQ